MQTPLTIAVADDSLPDEIAQCVSAAGVHAAFRQSDPSAWDQMLSTLDYIPLTYSSAWIDYQLACARGQAGEWWDLSLILHHDRRPCGVWPLSFSRVAGHGSLTSHASAVLPPLFVSTLPERSRKTLVQECLALWEKLALAAGMSAADSAESFAGQAAPGLSEWHDQLMRRGASAAVRHELFVDLSLPLDAIKARFRKSYRALITSGMRAWQVGTLTAASPTVWNEFRELHFKVSGRVTRSALSWELQHEAIAAGNALLVFLRNEKGEMVGGGFFGLTRDEGAYGVGAYDRSLFDKPLGHVVQHRAIETMKGLGLRWYRIGFRPFRSEVPAPTDKELSIGEFKQGFATHLFPQYVLHHDI